MGDWSLWSSMTECFPLKPLQAGLPRYLTI
jgi:hypothetical protein